MDTLFFEYAQQDLGGTERHIAGKGGRQNCALQPLRCHFDKRPIVLNYRLWSGQSQQYPEVEKWYNRERGLKNGTGDVR